MTRRAEDTAQASGAGPWPTPGRARAAAPGARHAPPGAEQLRLVWVYPDLLSTYGDRGNLLVLERRARLRGIEVEAIEVNADQPVPRQGDIYLLGGGEDLPQILAARRLRADGGLAAAAAPRRGGVRRVRRLPGASATSSAASEGEPVPGLGILDIRSGRGERRGVGEIVADVDPALGVPRLTGFENHQGVTRLGPGRAAAGPGHRWASATATAPRAPTRARCSGTYLHGPALVRNPGLADLLLSWAVGPLPPLDPADEDWAAGCARSAWRPCPAERRAQCAQSRLSRRLSRRAPARRRPGSRPRTWWRRRCARPRSRRPAVMSRRAAHWRAQRHRPGRQHASPAGRPSGVRVRQSSKSVGPVGQREPGRLTGEPERVPARRWPPPSRPR